MRAGRDLAASSLEWIVAAVCAVVVAAAASVALREARRVSAVPPVIARETPPEIDTPAGVPSGAVSLPLLLFVDRQQIRVGDTLEAIAARLGRQAEVGQIVDRGTHGDRLLRFYEHAGVRFVLVFEPLASDHEPRVVAIYAQ
jgi:hypothetical protein